jgi:hypothetical protein
VAVERHDNDRGRRWTEDLEISRVTEDSGTEVSEITRSRLTAWDSSGGNWVRVKAAADGTLQTSGGGGGSSPSKIDDAAFVIGTDTVSPMGALADETATDSVDEGDVGIPRMTTDRKLLVRVVGSTDANRLDIDASGRPTVNVNGTVTVDTELGSAVLLADNLTLPTAPPVIAAIVGYDGATLDMARTVSIGDTASNPGILYSGTGVFNGSTWDRARGDITNGLDVDVTRVQGTVATAGSTAADAALTANPVTIGGRASDAVPTAMSADGDVVNAWHDRRGAYKVALVDDAGDSAMDGTNNALRVNIVAGAGSGGTASTDDAAFTAGSGSGTPAMGFATSDVVDAGDVGVLRMTTSRDLMVTMRDSTGDSAMDDANNALRVNVVAGSSGGPSKVDDAAFTIATDSVAPMGALADETTTDSVDEGDVGIPRMTLDRKLLVRVVGATDANRLDIDASGRPTVNINGTVPVSGTITANAGTGFPPVVTDGSAAGTTGVHVLGTDGTNAQIFSTNATGHVNIADGGNSITVDGSVSITGAVDTELPAAAALADNTANPTVPGVGSFLMAYDGTNWDRVQTGAAATGSIKVDGSAVTQPISGTVTAVGAAAHDAAATGNPVMLAARANLNEPTAVQDADAVYLWADQFGRLVVVDGHPNDEAPVTLNATASGDSTVIAAPGAGVSLHICKCSVHNRSASPIVVALRDGTAGTIRWRAELAADGGGSIIDFGNRGWKLTANTLFAVNLAGASDVDVNVTEYYIAA